MPEQTLYSFLKPVVDRALSTMGAEVDIVRVQKMADGRARAIFNTTVNSLFFDAVSQNPIDIGEGRMCLRNLKYLGSILKSPLVDDHTDITCLTNIANDKEYIMGLRFRPNSRMEFNYKAINPFLPSLGKPKTITRDNFPVSFAFERQNVDELVEFQKVVLAAATSRKDGKMGLVYNGEADLIAEFGEPGDQYSSLALDCPLVLGDGIGEQKINISVNINLFIQTVNRLLNPENEDEGVIIKMSPEMLHLTSNANTCFSSESYYMLGKRNDA